jgi:hypothetical protein
MEQERIMALHSRFNFGLLLLGFAFATSAQAASVLDQVPTDALGFVTVRNLAQADAKIGKAIGALRLPLPAPLTVIKSLTNVSAGLDADRDLLVVLLPAENKSRPFHLAIWLPVKDYATLVRSLDGDADRRIAAVTIAGEDLLVAHYQDWAVIVDPDQRERLGRLETQPEAAPASIAQWAPFVDAHDVTMVMMRGGVQTAWAATAQETDTNAVKTPPAVSGLDNPFGGKSPGANSLSVIAGAFASAQQLLEGMPEIKRLATEADGIGCGLRFDDAGNALATVRAALSPDSLPHADEVPIAIKQRDPTPRLYDGGEFVMNGSGSVSRRWIAPMVAPYVQQVAAELASDYGVKVDDADVAGFRSLAETAVAQVQAVSVLTRPGGDQEGVYTNSFMAARVTSAEEFLKQSKAAIDRWNAMLGKAEGGAGLVFDENAVNVEGHDGTEYSIDMAKAVGAPPLPEARQSMEHLFGPGGRFRVQFIKADDTAVLMAIASQEQLAGPLRAIQGTQSAPDANDSKLPTVAELLTGDSDWWLYFSIDGYNRWLKRQMEAVVGPVIGGPVVRPFPASPPIGAAGGATNNTVWAEVAVPADTLRGIGDFLHQ